MYGLLPRLKAMFRRRQLDADLQDELAFHLAMREEKLRASGVDDPASAASRRFGNELSTRETLRDAWGFPTVASIWKDVTHAARGLARSPAFAITAILSLAIGIGANTAVFTAMHTLFLRSLPVQDPGSLRILTWTGEGRMPARSISGYSTSINGVRVSSSFSKVAYDELQALSGAFTSVAGFATTFPNVVFRGVPTQAHATLVTGSYFETLGVRAALGRTLQASDNDPGAPHVAVISWPLYDRLFGGTGALGQTVAIDRQPYTVVGITPPGFVGVTVTQPVEVFIPISRATEMSQFYSFTEPDNWWIQVVARLAPGTGDAQARAAMDVALARATQVAEAARTGTQLEAPRGYTIDGRTGISYMDRQSREFLNVLSGMVALVLLIACANVGNLLLARGSARARELAVRQSLGAGRFRLIRLLLAESLLIAVAGGFIGLLLARFGTSALGAYIFRYLDEPVPMTPDATVLAFTAALTILTALLCGAIPAIRATGTRPVTFLRQAGATAAANSRLARALILTQAVAAIVLVAGAVLFVRTLVNLGRIDVGFNRENLLTFHVDARRNGYKDASLISAYGRIANGLRDIPGVHSVTWSRTALLAGGLTTGEFSIPGRQQPVEVRVHEVGDDFLTVMGTPILLGRDLLQSDHRDAPPVAVVNQSFARKLLGDNPLGREIYRGRNSNGKPIRVVGVAADGLYDNIRGDMSPTVYLPWSQYPQRMSGFTFQIRTSVAPSSIAAQVRGAVAAVDSTLPIAQLRTQEEIIARALGRERSFAMLGTFFGGVAVLLACIGIYGVLTYNVSRRTSEFGVRLALGATSGNIRWLVLRGTIILIAIAAAVGIPASLAAAEYIESILYGVEPADPFALAFAAVAMLIAAVAAAWIPTERAARCDPSTALRWE